MNSVVKVGIIGIGNMGSAHFNCIYNSEIDGLKITSVCDIDKAKLKRTKESYTDIECFSDYKEFLLKSDIDAVIIAVPHPLHAEIAIAAFKAGKHVLVEKPIDIAVSKAEALCREAKKSKKIFAIMFNQRTNGLFSEARRIVKSGELGELKRSVWIITNWYRTQNYYDSGTWRATWKGEGGGVLLNQAPHNLDIWQWICGMPKSVSAFLGVGRFHNIEVEDEAEIFTEYENGATGVFITSTGDLPGTNRLEITGTKGKLVIENGILKQWILKSDERAICETAKTGFIEPEMTYSEFKAEKETAHKGILQNFSNAVRFGEELKSSGYDGVNELMISNAAYLSHYSGNKKIELPFDNSRFDKLLNEKIKASSLRNVSAPKMPDKSCHDRWQIKW